jgi:hypothetical protein
MAKVNNDMRCIVKYARTGIVEIWAKNEQISSVTVNVEAGKKYYVQMTTEAGVKKMFFKTCAIR